MNKNVSSVIYLYVAIFMESQRRLFVYDTDVFIFTFENKHWKRLNTASRKCQIISIFNIITACAALSLILFIVGYIIQFKDSFHQHPLENPDDFEEIYSLSKRALCPFDLINNHNPNRIPTYLSEIKCASKYAKMNGRLMPKIKCESLQRQVRVLLFDSKYESYVEKFENLTFGCIPAVEDITQQSIRRKKSRKTEDLFQIPAEVPT